MAVFIENMLNSLGLIFGIIIDQNYNVSSSKMKN